MKYPKLFEDKKLNKLCIDRMLKVALEYMVENNKYHSTAEELLEVWLYQFEGIGRNERENLGRVIKVEGFFTNVPRFNVHIIKRRSALYHTKIDKTIMDELKKVSRTPYGKSNKT